MAGVLAGLLSTILLQPLDVAKSRLQSRKITDPAGYLGMIAKLWNEGGVRLLWAGSLESIVRLAGGISLYLLVLGESEAMLLVMFGALTGVTGAMANLVLGGLSRALVMIVFCPITVLKTRAEVRGSAGKPGLLRKLLHLARTEGMSGLFAGLSASLIRDVPYSGLSLALHRALAAGALYSYLPSSLRSPAAAATAAFLATLITQPADVVRTHQVLSLASKREPNESAAAVLAKVYRSGGSSALYTGVTARVLMRAMQQTISWGVYEVLMTRRAH